MKLDQFTTRHLQNWTRTFNPSRMEPEELEPCMVSYLEHLDEPDAEALIERGWTAVFDAAFPSAPKSRDNQRFTLPM
jgi:hypothetical protein